ncbi:MAG TPA: aldehyde dehydrogenase family protein [Pseudonocardiaceae bacterium]|jgi:acyl-CoA reductase-like NAD-dependent aldehyde dehydrogenase|nr:aldehyde dehydrogenase family protein [Pseudonocardiaceae bacterium]
MVGDKHDALDVLDVRSPLDGRLLDRIPVPGPVDCIRAVATARQAQRAWARTAPVRRGELLHAAADMLRERAEGLATCHHWETGRPVDDAMAGVRAGADTLRQYAELGPVHRGRSLLGGWSATDLAVPEPRGVVLALTPWNDPAAIACGLLGAALVTGNTVVHKPSERAPATGRMLTELIAEHLPAGVLTCVLGNGATGGQLAENPAVDVIAHVGATTTGRAVAAVAARTGAKVILENGGNDALIVDDDVDPHWAAEQAALGAFAGSGQVCTSVERIFVHRRIAADFLTALTAAAVRWTDRLGPLVDDDLRARVHAHVEQARDAGATVSTGGTIPDGPGCYYPATVLRDCRPGMLIMTEETFGPVAPVCVVAGFDEALCAAADDDHGLAATVLTSSMSHAQRAWRELPVGTVKINAVFGGAPGGAAQPRRASGDGYGYGPELLDELTVRKVVHIAPPSPEDDLR